MPTRCACRGCSEPAATFNAFPKVRGYCVDHGGLIIELRVFLGCRGTIGFDAARERWAYASNR